MKTTIHILALLAALWGGGASAAEVYVTEQQEVGGVVTDLRKDIKAETGVTFVTQVAPKIAGYIFTHWSIDRSQEFAAYDEDGRAYDAAPVTIYEKTTLTAHYLSETVDNDRDGVADGYELYWYGDINHNGAYDGDGDGLTFAQELAAGTNPLFPDLHISGGVFSSDGALLQYNPDGLAKYIIRSEPEGELFETIADYAKPGEMIAAPAVSRATTNFAYWQKNGSERVTDEDGRAIEALRFAMPSEAVEYVAVCVEDEAVREQYYWYGREVEGGMASDTDGDGLTLAQEIAAGTNPLFADVSLRGVVTSAGAGELLQYNPENLHAYTLRSEPEGELFDTITDYAEPGKRITAPVVSRATSSFAYWQKNGSERVTDEDGRAVEALSFEMPGEAVEYAAVCVADADLREQYYWYGEETPMDSDTDGDGMTLAEEIAAGTNPLFANTRTYGVVTSGGELHDMNLQVYEQVSGVVLGGRFAELSYATGITPVVLDLNGDKLFDFVVLGDNGDKTAYLNQGKSGSPEFAVTDWQAGFDAMVAEAQITDVSGLKLDTPVEAPLSYTMLDDDGDGVLDLLASDEQGRIWLYKGVPEPETPPSPLTSTFILQHKVWGGSRPGFANGLKISAVDWEDDGNGDLLCGTAEGRLFLIRDPRGGKPTNLKLSAGADSVSIAWDPTPQSRIRGYRVYRASAGGEKELLTTTEVPKYLDKPEDTAEYAYSVASYSRFYKTGNSRPETAESLPTDPVSAQAGKVKFGWQPSAGQKGGEVKVDFTIENALNVAADQLSLKVAYDPAVLVPLRVELTGLTEALEFVETKGNGIWLVSGTGGEIEPGAGRFLTFVFAVANASAVADTRVTVEEFTLKSVGHENIVPVMANPEGKVDIGDAAQDETYVAAGSKGDLNADGRLSWEDVELFLKWKDSPADEVPETVRIAGDFNGDGAMNNRDYGLLKAFYSQKAKTCPSLKGWDKNHGYKELGAKK